jgi:hypothetical protein
VEILKGVYPRGIRGNGGFSVYPEEEPAGAHLVSQTRIAWAENADLARINQGFSALLLLCPETHNTEKHNRQQKQFLQTNHLEKDFFYFLFY